MKIYQFILLSTLSILLISSSAGFSQSHFHEWQKFSKSNDAKNILLWLQCKKDEYQNGSPCSKKLMVKTPPFFGNLGVFITLLNNKKVKGCFGAFDHKFNNFELLLNEYLKGALFNDNRYSSIDSKNPGKDQIILTITQRPVPLNNLDTLDISQNGVVFVTNENQSIIFVPMEIKSIEYLKRKIRMFQIIQSYSFRALTLY